MDTLSFASIITIAFLGSFSHCIGMCGGIVVAYTSTKIDPTFSHSRKLLSHLTYSLGRVTTYVGMGALFGFIGSTTVLSRHANATLYIIAGVAMVLTGLSVMGKLKFLSTIEYSLHEKSIFKNAFAKALKSKSYSSFYTLGILNGFLPCGFVYFFAFTAAATASPLWGMVVMGVFGLSTIPALASLGYLVNFLKNTQVRSMFNLLAGIAVVLFGFYTLYRGGLFFFSQDASLLNCH